MPLRNNQRFTFIPRSVVDAADGGLTPPGAMLSAENLIFDPDTPGTLQCRPGAVRQTSYGSFSSPAVISVAYVVGDVCYGLIASALNIGYDEPFAYNLATQAFVFVSGTSSSNVPLSQPTTGPWTPPTMALQGVNLIVTSLGFSSTTHKFGYFDTTDPGAPVWHATDTTTNTLPSVPTAVNVFNNRAWFVMANAIGVTDTLSFAISDATHVLTIGDSEPINALVQVPVTTAVQGIIQALLAFKSYSITEITGDFSTNDLTLNTLSDTIGSRAPRSIAAATDGIRFVSDTGVRVISQDGTVSDVDPNLQSPFLYSAEPSRISAGYNNDIYRVCLQNNAHNNSPIEEYWLDYLRKGWTGPHTFRQDLVVPYNETFVAFSNGTPAALFISDVRQTGASVFVDDGTSLSFLLETAANADGQDMYMNSAVMTVTDMQIPSDGSSYNFWAADVKDGVLSSTKITAPLSPSIWGSVIWGAFTWATTPNGLVRYNIPWTNPLIFSRLLLGVSGPSSSEFKISKTVLDYKTLQYAR